MAFPAGAAAAAARHRGLTNVPFPCMTTNLPASLLSRCGRASSGARTTPVRRARGFQPLLPDCERTPAPSRKFGCSMRDVCCPSPWQRRDATEGGRRGLGRAPPGSTGGFVRARRASLSLHPEQRGGAQRSRPHYDENASAARIRTSEAATPSTNTTETSHLLLSADPVPVEKVGPGVLVIGAVTKEEFTLHLLFRTVAQGEKRECRESSVGCEHTVAAKDPPQFY